MLTDATTTDPDTGEDCGACGRIFPTLAEVFGHDCEAINARRHAITYRPGDLRPSDTIDRDRPQGDGSSRRSAPASQPGATPAQVALIERLSEAAGVAVILPGSKADASRMIDKLKAAEREATPTAAKAASTRPNRYAGKCDHCGGRVPEGEGILTGKPGSWGCAHHEGQCPEAAAATPNRTPVTVVGVYQDPETGLVAKVQQSRESGRLYAKRLHTTEDGGSWEYEAGLIEGLDAGWLLTLEAAQEFGRRTGVCCCCGKLLTNPASIEAGIGPVCAGRLA